MGLLFTEWLGILGFIFALGSYVLTLLLNRHKGPMMAIYAVEHLLNSLSTDGATYTITCNRSVQNYGDFPDHITTEPEIIVYDQNGIIKTKTKKTKGSLPIGAGKSDRRNISFVLALKAKDWHHADITFNAYYYNKKRKKTKPKKDIFTINNIDLI